MVKGREGAREKGRSHFGNSLFNYSVYTHKRKQSRPHQSSSHSMVHIHAGNAVNTLITMLPVRPNTVHTALNWRLNGEHGRRWMRQSGEEDKAGVELRVPR